MQLLTISDDLLINLVCKW